MAKKKDVVAEPTLAQYSELLETACRRISEAKYPGGTVMEHAMFLDVMKHNLGLVMECAQGIKRRHDHEEAEKRKAGLHKT